MTTRKNNKQQNTIGGMHCSEVNRFMFTRGLVTWSTMGSSRIYDQFSIYFVVLQLEISIWLSPLLPPSDE